MAVAAEAEVTVETPPEAERFLRRAPLPPDTEGSRVVMELPPTVESAASPRSKAPLPRPAEELATELSQSWPGPGLRNIWRSWALPRPPPGACPSPPGPWPRVGSITSTSYLLESDSSILNN